MQELERPDCPRQSKKSKTVWITFVLASLLEHYREEEEEEEEEERVIGLYRSGLATNRFQVGLDAGVEGSGLEGWWGLHGVVLSVR